MGENSNNEHENQENGGENSPSVPGRVNLADLHKQELELKAAKEATTGQGKGSKRIFSALSMYNVAIDFALIIAVPLVAFVYAGRWADKRYGTKYIVAIGIILAIVTSSVGIYKHITKLSKLIKNK